MSSVPLSPSSAISLPLLLPSAFSVRFFFRRLTCTDAFPAEFTYTFPPFMLLGYIVQIDAMSHDRPYDINNPRTSRIDSWGNISRWVRGCTFTHDPIFFLSRASIIDRPFFCLQIRSTFSSSPGTLSSPLHVWLPQSWRHTLPSSRSLRISRRVRLQRRLVAFPLSNDRLGSYFDISDLGRCDVILCFVFMHIWRASGVCFERRRVLREGCVDVCNEQKCQDPNDYQPQRQHTLFEDIQDNARKLSSLRE